MSDGFDPYHKWLGIPPKEQPPHHYRLLGISLFEADADVIEAAADRQMAHVQTHKTGPHGALSQRLLNEISAAKICLLNAPRRAEYDAALRLALQPLAPPGSPFPAAPVYSPVLRHPSPQPYLAPAVAPSAESGPDLQLSTSGVAQKAVRKQRRGGGGLWIKVGGQLAASIVGLSLGYWVLCKLGPQYDFLGLMRNRSAASGTETAPDARASAAPEVAADDRRPRGRVTITAPKNEPGPSIAIRTTPPSTAPPAAPTTPASNATDLLSTIQLDKHVVEGDWRMEGGQLVGRGQGWPRLMLSLPQMPEEYSLDIVATRTTGDNLLAVGLVSGANQTVAILDMSGISGLHNVAGQGVDVNGTGKPGKLFTNGKPSSITCIVRKGRILVTCDGRTVIDWKGEREQLSVGRNWNVPDVRSPFLGVWAAEFRISKLELKPLTDGYQAPTTPTRKVEPPRILGDILNPRNRLAIPDDNAQKEAERRIKDSLRDDFAKADNPTAQAALARKLYDRANVTTTDPAEQYTLYRHAAAQASTAGQYALAREILDETAKKYEVNVLPAKSDALVNAARAAKLPAEQRAVAVCWLQLLNEAILADEYEAARQYAERAGAAARKSKDEVLLKLIVDGSGELPAVQAAFDAVRPAKEKLLTDASDQSACRLWGRFVCAYKNRWDDGLKYWAQGTGDDPLLAVVRDDLAAPRDSAAQVQLGDRWWDAAAGEQEALPKRRLQARAAHWYRKALPSLAGLQRKQVEDRIDEIDAAQAVIPRNKWIDVLAMVNLDSHKVEGDWGWRADELGISRRSRHARFMIPLALVGSYDFDVRFTLGDNSELEVALPVGDRSATVVVNGWRGTTSGLSSVDGRGADDNATTVRHPPLAPGQKHRIEFRVDVQGDSASIEIDVDQRKFIRWTGRPAALTPALDWRMPDPNALGVGGFDSAIVIHSAQLRVRDGMARPID
jgi:hypothetical protein